MIHDYCVCRSVTVYITHVQHRSRCAVLGVSTVKMAIALQRHLLCSFTALQLISGMSPNIFVLCVNRISQGSKLLTLIA